MEQDGQYLVEKKVEFLVNMKVGKLEEQLKSAISSIDSLQSEISVLKNKIARLNTAAPVQQTLSKPEGEKEVKKEANSRTGQFRPDDVSVEKMFYFGNK